MNSDSHNKGLDFGASRFCSTPIPSWPTVKAWIRLHGCIDQSLYLLFAYAPRPHYAWFCFLFSFFIFYFLLLFYFHIPANKVWKWYIRIITMVSQSVSQSFGPVRTAADSIKLFLVYFLSVKISFDISYESSARQC